MEPASWAAIAALVLAAVSAGTSAYATKKQNDAQEKARRMQNRQASLENQRRARLAVAQQRRIRAEMIQSTESMGVGSSSSLAGSTGALATQTAANIGAANTQLAGDFGINRALSEGAKTAGQWNTYSSIASIGSQFAGFASNRFYDQQQAAAQDNAFQRQMNAQMYEWNKAMGGPAMQSPAPMNAPAMRPKVLLFGQPQMSPF